MTVDHLADLPQLRRQLRAAGRPGPQARLLLAGLPAGRLPRPRTHQRRPAPRPPGLALGAPPAAPPARRLRAARRRPAPPQASGPARPAARAAAPPPGSANGQRPGAGSGDDLARIRRIITALLRKAAATSYPHEAAACREKAEALRTNTASSTDEPTVTPWSGQLGPGCDGSSRRPGQRQAQRIITGPVMRERPIVTRPGALSATERHGRS
jgi:hypothetical protein